MTSVKAILRKDKINNLGLAPIYIRAIKDRKQKLIRVDGVNIHPDDWDDKAECVKKSKRVPNYVRLNNLITNQKAKAQSYFIDVTDGAKKYNPEMLKNAVTGKSRENFTEYAKLYLDQLARKGDYRMHKRMKTILKKLYEFAERDLKFTDINVDFIKAYERYLYEVKKNATNTVIGNFKMIRKLFNDAIREDIIPAEIYPFRKIKFRSEQPHIEHLTEAELKAFEELELPDNTNIYHTRNIYVFACYAGGIRVGDLLALTWGQITDTHLKLVTQKTGAQFDMALPQRAREIIDLYRDSTQGDTDFVSPFMKNYRGGFIQQIESKTCMINKLLKDVALKAGVNKRIHFHTSRHTFAVRALRRKMSIYELSKIMTHSSVKITEIYANIANEDLDEAMLNLFD